MYFRVAPIALFALSSLAAAMPNNVVRTNPTVTVTVTAVRLFSPRFFRLAHHICAAGPHSHPSRRLVQHRPRPVLQQHHQGNKLLCLHRHGWLTCRVQANSISGTTLLGLLGVVLTDLNVLLGVNCSPITVIGGGSSCSAQPVCCQNNSFVR
jgi:hypothetical protein